MAKFKQEYANQWVFPNMRKYKMACCDCGLVHNVVFRVIKEKENKNGIFTYKDIPQNGLRVKLKASRNNRSTGQIRRWKYDR